MRTVPGFKEYFISWVANAEGTYNLYVVIICISELIKILFYPAPWDGGMLIAFFP